MAGVRTLLRTRTKNQEISQKGATVHEREPREQEKLTLDELKVLVLINEMVIRQMKDEHEFNQQFLQEMTLNLLGSAHTNKPASSYF